MSWITPTETHLLELGLSGPELEAFRGAALGEGQADPVAGQIAAVVNFMRGYFRRCSQHVMGEDGTIPAEGLTVFGELVVPIIQRRPAGALIDASGVRMDAKKDAVRWLERAAACEVMFEDSVPASQPDAGPVASPSYTGPSRTRKRNREDGL